MLIIVQPDLGSASVLIAMAMGVLLVAGAKARYILTISLLSVATLGAAFIGRLVNPYQLARVRVFFDENNPDLEKEVYQVTNAVQRRRHGRHLRQGVAAGPADERRATSR